MASATVVLPLPIFAHQVFDTMSARNKVSNFVIFPLGFYPVMDKDPIHMLVWSRDDGLVEKKNRYENGLCIRFKV
jgi:hypothetical protein